MVLRFLLIRFVMVTVLASILDFPHVDRNRNLTWFSDKYRNRNSNRIWFPDFPTTETETATATANRNRQPQKKTALKTNPNPYCNCDSRICMGQFQNYVF